MYACLNLRAMGRALSPVETIELAASAGFDGVDLPVRNLVEAGEDPRTLRARMEDLGLRAGAWPLPVAWRGEAGVFAQDLQKLSRFADAAARLGLARTGTYVMPETPGRPTGAIDAPAYLASVAELHVERLTAIGRILSAHGIQLGLEVIGVESFRSGCGLPFVTRLAELDRYVGALWRELPNLGIVLDAFHLHAADESVDAALAWGVERLVWVHVADLPAGAHPDRREIRDDHRGLPGENGGIDVAGFLRRLGEVGYAGPVTAEPMAGCQSLAGVPTDRAARLVAASLRSVWPSRDG